MSSVVRLIFKKYRETHVLRIFSREPDAKIGRKSNADDVGLAFALQVRLQTRLITPVILMCFSIDVLFD